MEKKYKLPEVAALQQIGFQFKHNTIKEAIEYVKQYVKTHRSEVMEIILPEFDGDVYKERLNSTDIFSFKESTDIISKISRIRKGFIVKSDYFFVIHPRFKDNKNILINAWKNRLKKYSVDTQLAMYDQSFLNINDDEAIDLVFYNELLRYIICKLPSTEFNSENDSLTAVNAKLIDMKHKIGRVQKRKSRLLLKAYILNYEKLLYSKYEQVFSSSESTAQKVTRLFLKILGNTNPIKAIECTSVEDKELVLRYFLKKQTAEVVKSKNTRGQGTHKAKMTRIINYLHKYPKANNTKVAKALGVSRKTIQKYRKF